MKEPLQEIFSSIFYFFLSWHYVFDQNILATQNLQLQAYVSPLSLVMCGGLCDNLGHRVEGNGFRPLPCCPSKFILLLFDRYLGCYGQNLLVYLNLRLPWRAGRSSLLNITCQNTNRCCYLLKAHIIIETELLLC